MQWHPDRPSHALQWSARSRPAGSDFYRTPGFQQTDEPRRSGTHVVRRINNFEQHKKSSTYSWRRHVSDEDYV